MTTTNTTALTTILATARHLGLSLAGLQILLLLAEHEELNMTCLAEEIGFSTSSMTQMAQRLIGRRLIERADRSALDRRLISLRLTELGRARVYQLTGTLPEPVAAVCDRR